MNNTTAKEILFIDANIADKQTLIAGVTPNVKVIELNNKSNVLDQMVTALKGQKNLDAIHIISHGSEGELDFSSGSINNSNLSTYSKQLKKIGQSLSKDGDILLYGCDIAKGDDGQAFINSIAKLTKADVAASVDATGASWLGGNWMLEQAVGMTAAVAMIVPTYSRLLATPADQNFDGLSPQESPRQNNPSITLNGVIYSTNSTNDAIRVDTISNVTGSLPTLGTGNGISSAWYGTNTGTYFQFASVSNSNDFKLVSLRAEVWGGGSGTAEIYTVTGYDNGTPTASTTVTFTADGTYGTGNAAIIYDRQTTGAEDTSSGNTANAGLLTFGSDWDNIDQVRFTVADSKILAIQMDQIDFSDPTPPADTTPPTFDVAPATSNVTTTTLDLSASLDEAGTIYYVVVANNDTAPTIVNVKAGVASGGAALASGNYNANSGNFDSSFSAVTGLSAGTNYDIYFVATDAAGNNDQASVTKVDVTTSATSSAVGFTGDTGNTNSPNATVTSGAQSSISITNTASNDTLDIAISGTTYFQDTASVFSGLGITPLAGGSGMLFYADKATNFTSSITFTIQGNKVFDFNKVLLQEINDELDTFTFTPNNDVSKKVTIAFSNTETKQIDLSSNPDFDGITSLTISTVDNQFQASFDNIEVENIRSASDTTPPTFDVAPATSNITTTTLDLSASLDEAGTIYYVVVPNNASAPSVAQVLAGQDSTGAAALKSGNSAVTTTPFTSSFSSITGLNGNINYDIYVVGQDDEGAPNVMATATKVDVATLNAAPIITDLDGDSSSFVLGGDATLWGNTTYPWLDVADGNTTQASQVTDADSTNFDGGNLTITYNASVTNVALKNGNFFLDISGGVTSGTTSSNADGTIVAGETLYYDNDPTDGIAAVAFGTVGSGSNDGQGGNSLVITFNANAIPDVVGTAGSIVSLLMQYISYTAPSIAGDRVFDVTVSDGDGGTSAVSTVTMTGVDETPPALDGANSTPVDNATGVSKTANLVIDFDENVAFGAGTIVLRNVTTSTDVETFTIAAGSVNSGDASIAGDKLTLNPASNLNVSSQYSVRFSAGSLVDTATTPNALLVISDDTTYNFTTAAASAPTAISPTSGTISTYDSANATAATLSVTDVDDTAWTFVIQSISQGGNTQTNDGSLFNLGSSGSVASNTLHATTPANLTTGDYTVVVRATDADGGYRDETLTVTVSNDLVVTVTAIDGNVPSGTYASDAADGGGLDLREALSYANNASGAITVRFADTLSGTITLGANYAVRDGVTLAMDSDTNARSLTITSQSMTLGGTFGVSVGSGDTLTLNSTLADNGTDNSALTKTGAGTLVMGGTNNTTSSGLNTVAVNAGNLSIATDSNLGTDAVTLNGGTLEATSSTTIDNAITMESNHGTVSNGNALILSGIISGAGDLTKSGAGALTLSGTNTYAGATIVSAGTISVAADSNLGTGTLTLNGGILTVTGSSINIDNTISLGANHGTVSNANAVTLSGIISGMGDLTKSGSGALTLSGTNTYTGATNITAGSLSVAADSNIGTGTLTLNGGTLTVTGSTITVDNDITLGNSHGTVSNANALTLSGIISGTGNLTKSGAGALTLSGSNTYAGTSSFAGGTVNISSDSNLGGGAVTLGTNGVLSITQTATIDNAIILNAAPAQITISSGATATLTGVISETGGSRGLNKGGAGTLVIDNNATYTGATALNGGIFELAATTTLATSGITLNNSSPTLKIIGTGTFATPIIVRGNGTNSISVDDAVSLSSLVSLDSSSNANRTLTKIGAGTLTMGNSGNAAAGTVISGANTYTLGLTVSGGTVSMAGDANLMAGTITLNGGDLTITGATTIDNAIALNSASTVNNASAVTLSGVISGSGALTKSGAGTMTLDNTGNSAATAALTVTGGAVAAVSDSQLVGGAVTLDGGALIVAGASTYDNLISLGASGGTINGALNTTAVATLSGIISGSGALTKIGDGTVQLSGNNTYAGITTISAGFLEVGHANALGSTDARTVVADGLGLGIAGVVIAEDLTITGSGPGGMGALVSSGTAGVSGSVTLAGNASIGVITGGTLTISGVIDDGASTFNLTKVNASGVTNGTLVLSGANSYGGTTTVSAGTLSIAADNNLGAGTLTLATGTTLAITEATTVNNAIALSGNATINTSAAATVSSVISGSFNVTKTGSSTLTLSGTDTYTGTTTVSAGTLSVTGSLANTSSVTVNSNATLDGTGSIFASGSTNTMTVSSGGTLSSGVSGAGTLTVNGNLTLSSGSTLAVDINGAIAGTGYDQVVVNGTVDVSGATLSATLGYTQGQGDSYTLINNDGTDGIIGTFGGLSEGGTQSISGVNFTASYVGGSSSNDFTLTAPTNAAPVVSNLNGDSVTWAGTNSTVLLDANANATVSDVELGSNWDGSSLTIQQVTSGGIADGSVNDVYNFASSTLFNATGGTVVKGSDSNGTLTTIVGSTQFATWTYTSTTGTLAISFDADATPTLVQDVIQHINYANATPYGNAIIRFGLSDGTSTTNSDVTVTSSTIYVDKTTYDANGDAADSFNLAEALAKAADGDTILIKDGTYRGQFVATTAVTIDAELGAGGNVTLEAPDTVDLVKSNQDFLTNNGRWRMPILDLKTDVAGQGTVTVKNLTVDGRYQAVDDGFNANKDLIGISTFNTNAVIDGVTVKHIAQTVDVGTGDYSGMSEHFGIVAEGSSALTNPVTVTIQNSTIGTFQKTGIIAWGSKLNVNILNNHITGVGVHGISNQNGMQIGSSNNGGVADREGTTGTIIGNIIDGLDTVSPDYFATAILLRMTGSMDVVGNTISVDRAPALNETAGIDLMEVSSPITVSNNVLNNLHYGITLESPYGTLYNSNHTISGNSSNNTYYAIYDDTNGAVNPLAITVNSDTTVSNDLGYLNYILYNGDDSFTDTGTASSSIDGGAGSDTINAGTGNDTLIGGLGDDSLTGGSGNDIFEYANSGNGVDTITDFGVLDAIKVTGRNSTNGTVTADVGTTVAANSVQLSVSSGITTLYVDTDGTADTPELEIKLSGEYQTGNFILDGEFIRYIPTAFIVTTNSDSDDTLSNYVDDFTDDGGLSLREALHYVSDNGTIGFAVGLAGTTITLNADATVKAGVSFDTDTVGNLTISGNSLDLSGALTLTNSTNDNLTIGSTLTGASGSLIKSGAGKLTLTGTNDYAGTTVVSEGILIVSADTNLGTGSVQIGGASEGILQITESGGFDNIIMVASPNGEVMIDTDKTVTLNGKLDENPDGSGNDLYKTGGGILILASEENESGLSGDIFVEDGEVQIASDDALPNGEIILINSDPDKELEIEFTNDTSVNNNITLSSDASFNARDGKNITISGEIKGNAGQDFTKKGTGTLTLTGENTFAGATKLNSGTLLLNGSMVNTANVSVGTGATLGGSGVIGTEGNSSKGAVSIGTGGTLSPGNSPGIITLNNGLTLATGATLDIQINNATVGTGYDQVIVKGAVNVTNATLNLSSVANLPLGTVFKIIDNDGVDAVTGTFSGASQNSLLALNGNYFRINYQGGDGNDVTLTADVLPAPPPPAAPIIVLAVDSGSSSSDAITKDGTVNVSGLVNNATWQYSTDGTNWQSGSGSSFILTGDGSKSVSVRQTSSTGTSSSATLNFTLDSTSPTVATVKLATDSGKAADFITNDGTITVSGIENNVIWEYSTDAKTWKLGTANSFKVTGDGNQSISVRQTDTAGNTSTGTLNFTLDTEVKSPSISLSTDSGKSNDHITNDGTIKIADLESGAKWEYSLDGNVWTIGSGNSVKVTGDGVKSIVVRQTDVAGNISATSNALGFTLDTAVAIPTIQLATTAKDNVTKDGTVKVSGLETGASWEYSLDNSTWIKGTGESFTVTGEGLKSVLVRQTDVAENTATSQALNFTIRTKVNTPTLALQTDSGKVGDGLTNDGTIKVSGLETEANWEYSLDGSTWIKGTGDSFTVTGDALQSVLVRQTDAIGNVATSAPLNFTLDTKGAAAPTIQLAKTSGNVTNDGTVNVSGLETGASWEYSLDGTTWIKGTGDSFTITDDGVKSVLVRQIDAAGNISANSNSLNFTLDTTIATPVMVLANDSDILGDGITNDGTVKIAGLETGASWEYSLDGTTWIKGTGDSFTITDDGVKSVLVRQTDAAGNISANSNSLNFTLDTTIATPVMVLANDSDILGDGITNDGTVKIAGLETGASWEYSLDGKNWVTGSGDSFVVAEDGEKSVFVRQTDAAGNQKISEPLNFILKTKVENAAPVFTSATSFELPEKQTAISTLNATDKEGDVLTYSVVGGDQQNVFTLNTQTGALAFKTPMLFDAKNAEANNYAVTVAVSDGKGGSTNQNIIVNVLSDLDGDGLPDKNDLDIDNDGSLNSIEDPVLSAFGTGKGDGNGDGIPDRSQVNISSIPTLGSAKIPTEKLFASFEVSDSYKITGMKNSTAPTVKGVSFPLGKFEFKIENVAVGDTITSSVYVDSSLGMSSFYKYNYDTKSWKNIATSAVSVGSKTKITFSLTDGGSYDADRTANGVIVDPGAPAMGGITNITQLNPSVQNLVETDSLLKASGKLTGTNLEQTQIIAQAAKIGAFGTFNVDETGNWSYATDSAHNEFLQGKTYTDTFEVKTVDGAVSNVTINIAGTKDTPILIDDLTKQVLSEAQIGSVTQNILNGQIGLQTAQGLAMVQNANKSWTDLDLQPVKFTFQGGTAVGTNLLKTTLANGSSLTINTIDGSYLYIPSTSSNTVDSVDTFKVSVSDSTLTLTFNRLDLLDRDGIIDAVETNLANLANTTSKGDLNNDGIEDKSQGSVANVAWITNDDFNAAQKGDLTSAKPVINIVVTSDESGAADDSAQLSKIAVLPSNSSVTGGSKPKATVTSGEIKTPWDALQFSVSANSDKGLKDVDATRAGTQTLIKIDISRADESEFNGYMKYISAEAINAYKKANLPLITLDGEVLTDAKQAGWYDYTQRVSGGDGARFLKDASDKITDIEIVITDNQFGDNDVASNQITDPSLPVILAVPLGKTLESSTDVSGLAAEFTNLTLQETLIDKKMTTTQLVDNPLACLPEWTLKLLNIPLKINQDVTTTIQIVAPLNGTGNTSANKIVGNSADNILNGLAGADTLTGGLGADTFVFGDKDVITDFNAMQGDKIDVRASGATNFVSTFTKQVGQIRFDGNSQTLQIDTNGDGNSDVSLQLLGISNLLADAIITK